MKHFKHLILGGGVAAGYAAQAFTEHDSFNGEDLAIISADVALPYDRPPLSKSFLADEASLGDIRINDPNFYHEHKIQVFLKAPVDRIHTTAKTLRTIHGDAYGFDNLLIATGSRAKRLNIPGADLPQVHYLRKLEDSAQIRQQLEGVEEVVIVGGGYIGLETAAICTEADKHVTMVFPEGRVMEHRFFTPRLSRFFEDALKAEGVNFIHDDKPVRFEEHEGSLLVTLDSGKPLRAGLVIIGVGAIPNDELAQNSELQVDDGILTSEYLETNVPGIYAAGDVANFYDVHYQKRRRTEHWQNAVDQGQYAARRMLGNEQEPFQALPYFFSDVLAYSYEVWGEISEGDTVVEAGNYEAGSVGLWWLRDHHVVAALLMDRPDEEREQAQQWIRERKVVAPNEMPHVISQQPA